VLDPELNQVSKGLQLLGKWMHKRKSCFVRLNHYSAIMLLVHVRKALRVRDNLKLKNEIGG
jgi:hypothetical protein